MTKRIIGRGPESGGLYIPDPEFPKPIAYSGITNLLEVHCRLGHSSFSLLKKLFPQFSSISSLSCESCQYTKLYDVLLSPRVNKRASAPFELVHSNVWGLCLVMSSIGYNISLLLLMISPV